MNFEDFQAATHKATPSEILRRLSQTLEHDQQYGAWFEALKLQARFELGLEPWSAGVTETLPSDLQRQLEERLLDACRLVGERLISVGRITEGWMYLRPVGDTVRVVELLRGLATQEEHTDQIIEVTLGHGVAPAWGFELLLGRMGTCNAITAFDTQMIHAALPERQRAAELLVRHLYTELLKNVRHHGLKHLAEQSREITDAPDWDLQKWVENLPDLAANQNYHTDPSHLSSVVRIGRIVDERSVQNLAWQMCLYGERLDELFQPQGYEVFQPYYETHQAYYGALLADEDSTGELELFRQRRTELTEAAEQPTALTWEGQIEATDVLVELLMRRRQYSAAVEVLLHQLSICGEHQRSRWTALLFRCCQLGDGFEPMLAYSQRLGDAFGFGLATFYQRYEANRR
ncbi:MAG: hypothetical protein JNL67_10030 [Planctomycetaceae bacterium]|nr:hypothetical protein [Planctomycetaceae bacterium]